MRNASRIFFLLIVSCGLALAQSQYKVIYNFHGLDGASPRTVILDPSGNLYGTTLSGGNKTYECSNGCGTVFKLSPNQDGTWSETVLYAFCNIGMLCRDGYEPTSLTMDAKGNLYGTTYFGGASCCGEIYELSPSQDGTWTFNILYSFCSLDSCPDGENPSGALAIDAAGNLYGATVSGGNNFNGVVFKLSPPSLPGGTWTESVVYDFCSDIQNQACLDGFDPRGGVTLDSSGNLIGTTFLGGQYLKGCGGEGCGTVFKLSPSSGAWAYTQLDATLASVGFGPVSPVVTDSAGNVYGTFELGGGKGNGALFKISPNGQHSSQPLSAAENGYPQAALVLGNTAIYGSTLGTGSNKPGTIFQITSTGQSILHKFCSAKNCADGTSPLGLVSNSSGVLYGVAEAGGTGCSGGGGCGVVYMLKP
ncbi:MAG TPA: choice-of-anchor tandem repeat GloVer-containing protein [Verrucomicrobiae bacterium]|nr:choice-of-anchor tandem repeat GloVer-containing protein [Verrucomicrobiae bacterium]